MKLGFHGGRCCGVKTIYDLGDSPDLTILFEKFPDLVPTDIDGGSGKYHPFGKSYFVGECPLETAEKRMSRFLEYFDKKRTGLVEVTTTSLMSQTSNWKDVLESFGFEAVAKFHNSNSYQHVTVWHRTGPKKEKKPQKPLSEIL